MIETLKIPSSTKFLVQQNMLVNKVPERDWRGWEDAEETKGTLKRVGGYFNGTIAIK